MSALGPKNCVPRLKTLKKIERNFYPAEHFKGPWKLWLGVYGLGEKGPILAKKNKAHRAHRQSSIDHQMAVFLRGDT